MKAIVLACGDSKRFAAYTNVPKQFLKFSIGPLWPEAQMWENAIAGLQTQVNVVAAFRRDHHQFVEAPRIFKKTDCVWNDATLGQADTLLQTLNKIDVYDQEIMVINCDQGFAPGLLDRMVQHGRKFGHPAALTFKAPPEEASRWSYVDGHPRFFDAEEKRAIGTHALAGAYYFPSRTILVRALTHLKNWERGEMYLSQVYGHMLGAKISVEIRRDDWYDWGVPEALAGYLVPQKDLS